MKKNTKNGLIIYNKFIFALAFVILIIFILRVSQIGLMSEIDGINLKEFASNRNTYSKEIIANRGTIFDANGNPVAQNVSSYTVIAYLASSRTTDPEKPRHVVDINMTAEKLSPLLNMSVESLVKLLDQPKLYQVELGPGGRSISELLKEKIVALNLPGIDFVQSYKRYYPNGDFASYTIGYAKNDEDGEIIGEMGIEAYFNEELKGQNGFLQYQRDGAGYKLPNIPELKTEAVEGKDVYLTIDENIQLFIEEAVKKAFNKYQPEWLIMTVLDAKTGKILGTTSSPSFDPNIKNISSYLDPLVSIPYEPGSIMKVYTYMAAMEKGVYDGNTTYTSGTKKVGDYTIKDWNNRGWGVKTYNEGLILSSNTAIVDMIERGYLNKDDLKNFFTKMGFGNYTGIDLPGELKGSLNFEYEVEIMSAGFGQGITTTPIQHLQALTAIANGGVMLKPYIVEKIVDPATNQILYQSGKEEIGRVVSESTASQIKDLMYRVVNDVGGTGSNFKIDGYDIMGKTGTAQIADTVNGGYLKGDLNMIRSFTGIFPSDDPEIIVYVSTRKANLSSTLVISEATNEVVKNVSEYLGIFKEKQASTSYESFTLDSYLNKKTTDITEWLNGKGNVIVIGNGDKIIDQYPSKNSLVNVNDKIFLKTNSKSYDIINMVGWSSKDVDAYANLIDISVVMENYGFVVEQSQDENGIKVKLDGKIKEKEG